MIARNCAMRDSGHKGGVAGARLDAGPGGPSWNSGARALAHKRGNSGLVPLSDCNVTNPETRPSAQASKGDNRL